MFASLPEASKFVGRRAGKVPWIYGALFSWSEMHFWLLELPFEIMLFRDPACYFLGEMFCTCCSSYPSFPEIGFDPLTRGGRFLDPSCFTRSLEVKFVCLLIWMQDLFLLNVGGSVSYTDRIHIIRISGA